MLRQSKGVTTSRPEQGKILSHKAINLALVMRALYLFVRKCSRPKSTLM